MFIITGKSALTILASWKVYRLGDRNSISLNECHKQSNGELAKNLNKYFRLCYNICKNLGAALHASSMQTRRARL